MRLFLLIPNIDSQFARLSPESSAILLATE